MSRAPLFALVLAACGAATATEPTSAEPAEAATSTTSEATTSEATTEATVAPLAEATPTEAEAPTPSHLRWELVAEPARVSMRHLDTFRLRVVATNEGTAIESPIAHELSFTVNGESSMEADMAFTNGISPTTWSELPPGASERSERALGDLFGAPGTYDVAVTIEGVEHAVRVVVVR